MNMPGRTYNAGTEYRYGFNGKELDTETTGTTSYDYGFRIYSPALGKFLSVDPLTQNYPWYTPYQFAGNKPIWCIDLDGLEEYNAIKRFLDITVDMNLCPKSYTGVSGITVQTTYNLHGYSVNNLYFWEKVIEKYPRFLDDWNKNRVLTEGKSPIFTGEMKINLESQQFETSGLKIGDVIEHHHINQGRTSVPVTRTEHKKIPVQKSSAGKATNKFGKFLKGIAVVAFSIGAEVTGLITGNPDAIINGFGSTNEVGKVYKNNESGLYFTIVSLQQDDNSSKSLFWFYSGYEWNDKLKKYVGTNPVGYGLQEEEKQGYLKVLIYDLDGKLKSAKKTGTPTPKA